MKFFRRISVIVLAAVLAVTSATAAFAGELSDDQKEIGFYTEEADVSDEESFYTENQTELPGEDVVEPREEGSAAEEGDVEELSYDNTEIAEEPSGEVTEDADETEYVEEPAYDETEYVEEPSDDVTENIEKPSDEEAETDEDSPYIDTEDIEVSSDEAAGIDEKHSDEEASEEEELSAVGSGDESGPVMPWTSLQNKINNAADGDTIVLEMDYTAVNGDSQLVIEGKNITLDLNGFSLNRNLTAAKADGSAILIRSGAKLMLINSSDQEAVITGGFANNGGAINNQGTLWVQNVTFKNNHASYTNAENIGRGGAIFNNGTLSIFDCIIGGDSSDDSNSASDGGGIFSNTGAGAEIRHVVIKNNVSVNHSGGGIVNYGFMIIEDCELSLNRSNSSNGGAVWNNNTGDIIISGCNICGNTAKKGCGGAIFNKGSMSFYSNDYDCTISENTADDGGGIYNDSTGVLDINGASITGNGSLSHGGGGIVNYGVINIDSISVTNNSAKSNGGGIWSNGTVNIRGRIEIRDNYSPTNNNNLYLKSGKVLTVTGAVSEDSDIRLCGENLPRPVTSGWEANSGITSEEQIEKTVRFDPDYDACLYDDGELNVLVYYVERAWNGLMVTEHRKTVPESPKRIPSGGGTLSNGWYAVFENETVSGLINVPQGGEVNIVLMNDKKLTTEKGIYVPVKAVLNIFGQNGDYGQLEAKGAKYVPGIGGNDESGHGNINFHGGKIKATGGDYGAGVGTGDENESACGTIFIYGGDITAQGGTDAAGIGGGNEDKGGKIIIYGGTVTAKGGKYGAGIGGGDDSEYNDITIYGGTVTAQGGDNGAGIGEGYSADTTGGHTITIKGGTVTATGGDDAAGIGGSGSVNSKCIIVIDGGAVDAYGGECGAGIGSGSYELLAGGGDFAGSVTINGGNVHAYALKGSKEFDKIRFCYYGSSAIGSGYHGDVLSTAKITINGGSVTAVASYGGAVIGAGPEGDCNGTVTINGGNIALCLQNVEMGSDQDNDIVIIGHGYDGSKNGNLYLDSSLQVWFEGKAPVAQDRRVSTCRSFSNQWLHIGIPNEEADGFRSIDGKWFFMSDGEYKTGWVKYNNKYYYFNPSTGTIKTGWLKYDGRYYYFNPSTGALKTGWVKSGGRYYYINPSTGTLKTGWLKYRGRYYYLSPRTGNPVTGKQRIGGKTYTFNAYGVCVG